MKVKEILRTANVAWSPAEHHPIYLAAGTAAQQLDATFSTSASLDIYSLNLGDSSLEMPLKASLPSKDRFHKLVWGAHGLSSGDKPSGVLVGGLDMGHIQMFDPSKIILNEPALVAESSKHTGAVRSLDFNPFQLNLLASGASESEIFIWDLNNPSAAMSPGAASQPPDDVTSVAWNRQVQHILGSTFASRCVVWDLRKNEPIIKVSDSTSRMKIKVMAWHPDIATQLCIASEDDLAPVIELWDLRFATSPLKTMESHQKGVLSIAWCPQDPDLLLSCGKDNRILVWNPNSDVPGGEVLCELATSNQWSFDVSWCPRNPSIISTSSFDGHVAMYSVMGGSEQHLPSTAAPTTNLADSFPGMESFGNVPPLLHHPAPTQQVKSFMSQLKRPPKWMRAPCGSSFGFGGKLVSFGVDASQPSRQVFVSQVITETELLERSQGLEQVLSAPPSQLQEFCTSKAQLVSDTKQRQIWELLQSQYAENPRQKQLELLGFQAQDIANKVKQFTTKAARDSLNVSDLDDKTSLRKSPFGSSDGFLNGGDAFDTIAQVPEIVEKLEPFHISVDNSVDGLISQALLTGQIGEAVELCLNADRMAEALLLAMCGGQELYQSTQKRFIQSRQEDDGFALIKAVVTSNWHNFVQYGSLDNWREMLAAVLSYARAEELPFLCELLGHRLTTEQNGALVAEAVLCYICAGNLEKMVQAWVSAGHPLSTSSELQDLVEQVMVLRKALQLTGRASEIPSGPLTSQLCRYASLLAGQGSLSTALSYLDLSSDASMVELKNRLQKALGYQSQPQARSAQPLGFTRPQQQPVPAPYTQSFPGTGAQGLSAGRFAHASPPVPQPMAQTPHPSLFNPLSVQANPIPYMPQPAAPSVSQQVPQVPLLSPGAASNLVAPPPPAASAGTGPSKGGLLGRSRAYVHDPSMFDSRPAPQNLYSPAPMAPAPAYGQSTFPQMPSASPYGTAVGGTQGLSMNGSPQIGFMPNTFSYTSSDATTSYGATTLEPSLGMQAPQPVRPMTPGSITASGSGLPPPPVSHPPPGWNDPPMFTALGRTKSTKVDPVLEPITHPLFGVAQPDQQPPVSYQTGNFYNPMPATAAMPTMDGYGHAGVVEQAREAEPTSFQPPPAPVEELRNIPEEHQILDTVFHTLKDRCLELANSPQMRRKLDDVAKKLDNLSDRLRSDSLSSATLLGLHQIVQAVQNGDYATGLSLQTQLVSGLNFSEIGAFIPGIKVLLQLAAQLGVYLQ